MAPSLDTLSAKAQQSAGATRLVLASASPRRRELLAMLGVPFSIAASDAEESDDSVPPEIIAGLPLLALPLADHPTLRAWRKVHAVWEQGEGKVLLGADTIVVLDGQVLNKPRDAGHACAMLARLSGRVHTVYTGLCVVTTNDERGTTNEEKPALTLRYASEQDRSLVPHRLHIWFDLVASEVTIAPLCDDEIAGYVATGEPLDKAGAYGIQGLGGRLVRQVVGSYTAVVGLPLPATGQLLTAAGVTGLVDPPVAYKRWLSAQGKEPLPCPPTLP